MVSRLLLISTLFTFWTFCFINHIDNTAAFGFRNVTDRGALLAIKVLITSDPFGALSSWNNSLHFCGWQGVTCGRRHQRVIALNLSSLQLAGSLSPHIGNLTFLRRIDLDTNNFHGTIPNEFGRLFRLQVLSLWHNSFQGKLPRNLSQCSNLEYVYIMENNLTGEIPSELGSLPKLNRIGLGKNQFIGSITPLFGNISSLRYLSLPENNLQGSIPAELGSLSELEHLDLSSNHLSGTIPKRLYNTSSIDTLSFNDNQLNGRLPFDLGLTLPSLRNIYLGLNKFTGPIPMSTPNASRLEIFDLAYNIITGPVPKNLGNLQNLLVLNIGGNPLGNENDTDLTFLTSLTNCTNLRMISLLESDLRGALPSSIANLSTNLYWLSLRSNYMTGVIPSEIGNLQSLQFLSFGDNMLKGGLPKSVGKLSKLGKFYAFSNKISGEIPSSLGNISGLLRLRLEENLLEGTVPVSLANCIHMELLELSRNYLSGVVPEKIFALSSLSIGLSLGSNQLTGRLPSLVGNMRNLVQLDLSNNELSGEIPSALENCLMLETFNITGNFFQGNIPSSFKKLRSIRILDLSRNNLSGQIPEFLGELPLLVNLNLSFNKFKGEVPSEGIVFKNATAFSVVGNDRLCGGIKGIQLPACPKGRQKNYFSRRVVILVATVTLFILLLLACIFAVVHRKKSPKRKQLLASPSEKKLQMVSYEDLVHATDGFASNNVIGEGRYGTIYKAMLRSYDQNVAVKVLKLQQAGAGKTFVSECEALRCIRHRNLVRVITACSTIDFKGNDFKALIFEYLPNGSLENWLHPSSMDPQDSKGLSLLQRLNLLIDVASALDYLHNHCEKPVVHCDLKPGNILLDTDFTAHVGDFGLAKILSSTTDESLPISSSSLCIRGTFGYVAPEYGIGGEVSVQGDVYSYGILVLEMFTGKRPTDSMFTANFSLHNFVKTALPDLVLDIVDPLLASRPDRTASSRREIGKTEDCLVSIFQVGVLCSADSPSERIDIGDALSELNKIKNILYRY